MSNKPGPGAPVGNSNRLGKTGQHKKDAKTARISFRVTPDLLAYCKIRIGENDCVADYINALIIKDGYKPDAGKKGK